jgi:hypothetical protein
MRMLRSSIHPSFWTPACALLIAVSYAISTESRTHLLGRLRAILATLLRRTRCVRRPDLPRRSRGHGFNFTNACFAYCEPRSDIAPCLKRAQNLKWRNPNDNPLVR